MDRRWLQVATLGLVGLALACWVVMFLSGHDIWHDVGRPDIWNLPGPPYADLRVFVIAFYLLLIALAVHVLVTVAGLIAAGKSRRPA
jgi:hypothetical protein